MDFPQVPGTSGMSSKSYVANANSGNSSNQNHPPETGMLDRFTTTLSLSDDTTTLQLQRQKIESKQNGVSEFQDGEKFFQNKEYLKAIKAFSSAVKLGNESAVRELVKCFAEQLKWRIAPENYSATVIKVANSYEFGKTYSTDNLIVPKDISVALALYKESANNGNQNASFRLGEWYEDGVISKNLTIVKQDFEKAADYYHQAQERGHADAGKKFQPLFSKSDKAIKELQFQHQYQTTVKGFPDHNITEIKQQLALAYMNSAYLYQKGFGVELNLNRAIQQYDKAIKANQALIDNTRLQSLRKLVMDSGDSACILQLGHLYHDSGNAEEAIFFYRESAERGSRSAQVVLEKIRQDQANTAIATIQNCIRAVDYFTKAKELTGDHDAREQSLAGMRQAFDVANKSCLQAQNNSVFYELAKLYALHGAALGLSFQEAVQFCVNSVKDMSGDQDVDEAGLTSRFVDLCKWEAQSENNGDMSFQIGQYLEKTWPEKFNSAADMFDIILVYIRALSDGNQAAKPALHRLYNLCKARAEQDKNGVAYLNIGVFVGRYGSLIGLNPQEEVDCYRRAVALGCEEAKEGLESVLSQPPESKRPQ